MRAITIVLTGNTAVSYTCVCVCMFPSGYQKLETEEVGPSLSVCLLPV